MFLIIQGDTVAIFSSNLFSMVRKVDCDRLFINHNCAAILWLSIWQEMDTRMWASFLLYREFLASQKKKKEKKKKTSWNIVVLCLTVCLRHRNSKSCFFFFVWFTFFESFFESFVFNPHTFSQPRSTMTQNPISFEELHAFPGAWSKIPKAK